MPTYRLSKTMDRSALVSHYPRMTDDQRRVLGLALQEELGSQAVITDQDQLLAYSYDATGERHFPDVVVLPSSVEDVQTVVRIANTFHAPIIGRGASSNLSGGTTPLVGGVVVSFVRMNRIEHVNVTQRMVTVQPGVINADLQGALQRVGFFYAPDPSSHRISTLGGNIAENSGGPHCVKYGVTTHHVLALDLVMADGSRVRLPRVGDTSRGLDLSSLIIGSEGTLALVTGATLAIQPLPQEIKTVLISFPTVESALRAVSAIVAARLNPATLELMDKESLRIVEDYVHAGYPTEAGAVLLVEFDGTADEVRHQVDLTARVMRDGGALRVQEAKTAAESEALWRGRRAHYGASARLAPHLWVQDVTVPRPKLAEMMDRVLAIGKQHQVLIVTAAHAGDGNLHPTIPYDPNDSDQVARLRAADRAILEACVEMGGAITGEHGIGIDKAEHLPLMYSPDELQVMNDLKGAWDPENLLNPFKALWIPHHAEHNAAGRERFLSPESLGEVVSTVLWAREADERLDLQGQGRRSQSQGRRTIVHMRSMNKLVDLDIENLSVEVQSGMSAASLSRLLAQEGLELAGVEPFMDDTMGGLLASNALYWRDSSGRGWRDVVLAAQWVDGLGRTLRFGRKTMKNVAGYDLAKLLVGSCGSIGIITRLTLKVRPLRERWGIARTEPLSIARALEIVNRLLQEPNRPEGLLLKSIPHSPQVELLIGDSLADRARRHWIEERVQVAMEVGEGVDGWLAQEKDRLHHVYGAIANGTYERGWIYPGNDVAAWLERHLGHTVYFSPAQGWYEMVDADAISRDVDQAELSRLYDRVTRVFDPDERFYGFRRV